MVARNTQWFMQQRRAGVCLHATSLPGSYGIGEIGDAAFAFIDTLTDMKLNVWQFLPLGPTGFGNSPYQSLSTFAGNEMLIDLAALVRENLLTLNEIRPLTELPEHEVDFENLIPRKTALLRLAAKRFYRRAAVNLKSEFARFCDEHDRLWLHDYAMFRVLKSQHGEKDWLQWHDDYRARDSSALRKFEARAGKRLERIKIIQFFFYHQWRQVQQYAKDKGVLLFGDLPIYIPLDSADAWVSRRHLSLDKEGKPERVAGVPPDYFSKDGQLWGNPVYDWDVHAAENYRWWIARIRHASQMANIVRIDHFRGFESFFAVQRDEKTARNGEWYKGPGDDLFEALHGALGEVPVVAEDLGVITPEVDALRRRHHIPGMRVLQFDVLRDDFDITTIDDNCVCYTGTHDNDTTVGWYLGETDSEPEERLKRQRMIRDACDGRAATIHLDLTRLAFSSAARLAIVPMQDYLGLGSEARLNTPGTIGRNWRWRLRSDQVGPALPELVAELVENSGRNPSS